MLRVEGLTKTFEGLQRPALRGLRFALNEGETLTLLGESGSGKTTLLRLIAGHEDADVEGRIIFRNKYVLGPAHNPMPGIPGIGWLPQNFGLIPNYRVEDQLLEALFHTAPAKRPAQIRRLLRLMNLKGRERAFAHELSGGEQQRVALARLLARKPYLLLLDEPFSQQDRPRQGDLLAAVLEWIRTEEAAAILVTHDAEQGLAFGQRTGVLHRGRLLQLDSPQVVYAKPKSRYVARMTGYVSVLPLKLLSELKAPETHRYALVRPEEFRIEPQGSLSGTVKAVHFTGSRTYAEVSVSGHPVLIVVPPAGQRLQIGQSIPLALPKQLVTTRS